MKRKRSMSKAVLSFCLAVLLALQTVMFSAAAYAESALTDPGTETVSDPSVSEAVYAVPDNLVMAVAVPVEKTAVFMEANSTFPLNVTQGNAAIDPNGTIQGRQQFTLKSEGLKVPVNGDDPNPTNADSEKYIQKGDWIELKREDYFKEVVLPTATKTLNAQTESGMKPLGTAYFTPNSIRIVFNGDDYFFNGVGRGIVFSFETTADADVTGMAYGETKPINIFGGAYQLKNPDVTAAYSITLTSPGMIKWDQYSYRGLQPAQFVEGAITWQSTVSAFDQFDNTIKLSLDGKTFYTNPASYNTSPGNVRGIYVPGSFKVNGIEATPSIGGDGSLTYTFPVGTGVDPKVEYKTWIPKDAYYYEHKNPPGNLGRSYRDMRGTVELKQSDDTVLVSAGQEISFAPDWIQASASYDHLNQTITWTVVVNQYNKKGLKNFTITNVLPTGLEFTSATWQTWVDGIASGEVSITPDANSVYSFGDIDGKVELVIKSKVKNGSSFRIDPRANWVLDTPDGIQNNDVITGLRPAAVTDEAIVTIGAHTFTKSGSISMEDFNFGGVTWTVNLTPQYALPNAAVYDVLVHGGDLNVLDSAVDETGEVTKETIAKIKANVNTSQLWKQYHKDTLKSANGLTMKAIPLTVNGEVVADLIKVTGYTDKAASFSFRALETNSDFLFKQDINVGKGKWNRALLFDGETVKAAENGTNLHLRMLNKDMLFASKPLKADGTLENVTPNNVGSYIRDDNNEAWTISAYDRTTKTVTFRLGLNMPGYNTDAFAKAGGNRVISNIKLVDTLPEGWEFVPFSEGKDFELWKGYSDNAGGTEYGVRNDARTLIEPGTNAHVVSFSHSSNVGTFSFSKLESPYVILVKARPSNAALEKYLEEYTKSGTTKQVMYNKADLHMTWGGVEKTVTEQRKVIVPIQTLSKSVSKPTPGVLEWTVNYTPPFNMEQGVFLQDTIGANMNLRYDVDGKLVLTAPSMAVYRAKLTASGALEKEGAALDLSDPNAEVQVEAEPGANGRTVLKFKMNDPNKFYQFVYQTEVDNTKAKAGDKMGNEVKLVGDDKLKSISAKSESTLDSSDVAGSSSSNALLPLKKVDPNGNPLKDVQFTLYKKEGGTQVAQGTTGNDGKLNLLFPDPGYYELKETYIDTNTWLPTTRIYQVYVGNTPGKPIWVDGIKVDSNNLLVVPTPLWETGDLKLDMQLEGKAADQTKDFSYKITFSNGKSYDYYDASGKKLGTVTSGGKITLKGGNVVTFKGIPDGITYTIVQDDYTSNGYTTNPANLTRTGSIVKNSTVEAHYINAKYLDGQLTVSQTVTGNGGEKDKLFKYTVKFDGADPSKKYTYTYTKIDGTNETGTIQSGGTFMLRHGENIVITGISKDTVYTVTENDYTTDGYAVNLPEWKSTGTITDGEDAIASFVNTRMVYGGLLIGQTVAGNGGEKDKLFTYTVKFDGANPSKEYTYTYTKIDGTSGTGTIQSGGTISLKHGETAIFDASQILKGVTYTVTQTDYTSDGYTTDPKNFVHTGTIEEKKIAEARFINTRYLSSTLTLTANPAIVPGDGKTPSEITATLIDHEGKPVADREIVFTLPDNTEVKATTNAEGKAVITYTPQKLTGSTPEVHTIGAKSTSTVDGVAIATPVTVTAMPAAITGVLRDNTTGKVIPNATVTVKNDDTKEEHTITTDENGVYFLPVPPGGSYTVSYTQQYNINGTPTPVTFTQKAEIDSGVTGGQPVPAEITAVGIVLLKQPDGKSSLLNSAFAGKMHIYLRDATGDYILDQNGVPKAFDLQSNGTFVAEGLSTGSYKLELRYEFELGKELTVIKDADLNVSASGELNISEQLVDPYGKITDAKTGAFIEGAEVTLYYADTPRNKANGIVPGTKVTLPVIPGFAPNDNASPSQISDATGAYAYMVFPDTDYYLVVSKAGYVTHTSATISVGSDIVRYDVQLTPISSGGNGNNGGSNGNNGGGNGNNGGGNGNNGGGNGNNGGGNGNNGGGNGNNGGGNGNNGGGNGNNGGGNGNNGGGNGNNGGGNGNNGGGNGNNGGGNGNNGGGNGNNGGGNGNNGGGNGNNGTGTGNNGTGTGNNGTDNGNNGTGTGNNELDDVPQTGDNSTSPIFYMALAMMSLIVIGFCLSNRKKEKHIQ
ncbi:DUF7601 domain-containing protein [Paenibacillus guangzhouensis]|uniref:DUF7601 domain-containing protein n=1 Tax=Paenibacillus guangzhouensis TaxID=1473112 RepID=UPI0012668AEA|nr:carboxypeptidase regulatory-like domain-containing protein [Paenibacillus guangzhouensis]